jgi:periplasmic divalent cation tolerance protein
MSIPAIHIAWTTVASPEDADRLAEAIIASRLAACVQMDAPIRSAYPWKGKVERETEIRLWIKYPAANEPALQQLLGRIHPYETPQWIAVRAEAAAPPYARWVTEMAVPE